MSPRQTVVRFLSIVSSTSLPAITRRYKPGPETISNIVPDTVGLTDTVGSSTQLSGLGVLFFSETNDSSILIG